MSEEAKYCPLTDLCKHYSGCSSFSNFEWLNCTIYKKIRAWVWEQSEEEPYDLQIAFENEIKLDK